MSTPRLSTPPPLDSNGRSSRLTLRTQIVWSVVDAARIAAAFMPSEGSMEKLRAALDVLDEYDRKAKTGLEGPL